MTSALVIAFIGALVFGAHLFVGMFAKTRVPDVLLLIVIGLLLGPVGHLVTPAQFGGVGPVFTTITLVFILFESGTELHIGTLRSALSGTFILATLNFVVTAAVVAAAAWRLAHLGPMRSLVMGAVLGGTSPAVVIPLSAQLKMRRDSSTILFLESAVGDVFSIVIALALLDGMQAGNVHWGPVAGKLVASFLIAAMLGALGAVCWSNLLSRMRTLQNGMFTTAAFVFLIFGVTEMLGYSGAIAALVFGIGLGNVNWHGALLSRKFPSLEPVGLNEHEKTFFAEIVFLLKMFFFVYIGLSIQFKSLWWITFGLTVTLLIFIVRIPIVRFGVNKVIARTDACRMAAMAPKGLAAAVLASVPLQQGMLGGDLIQNSTYAVVLFSIILTSLLIFLQDRTYIGRFYGMIFSGFGKEQARAAAAGPMDAGKSEYGDSKAASAKEDL
ncbi:MAG: cation:proton antiporter [Acidobacteriota bacterium]|nr:cation:proton antiporter [Acidobacteriota bacterium]